MRSRLQTILPIADDSAFEFLVATDGTPVWPLSRDDDRAALERTTMLFGARLERVMASQGVAPPLSTEHVVALGRDANSAGLLHAHLTRRRFLAALDLDALTKEERPSVVVTTPEYLSTELLEWLYNSSNPSAPGTICGERGTPLRMQVLVRAAAATLCGPLGIVQSDIFPTLSIAAIRGPGFEVLGAESSVSERREALARGAGVLTIMTHSDGVDAFLGPDLSICGMGRTAEANLPDAPRCRLTGFCPRHEIPVSEAVRSNAVLPPEEIAARVFVWDVCFGVMPPGSAVDPRWGMGKRLLESGGIGAILTTWRIVLSSPEHVRRVSRSIASGVSAGIAVGRFNASQISRARNHRMCLLGDPRVRLPKAPVRKLGPKRSNRLLSSQRAEAELVQQLALLRLCMADAKLRLGQGRSTAAARALEAIDAFEVTVSKGVSITALDPQPGDDMRAAFLDYALSRGKLLDNWMPFACRFTRGTPRICPVCHRQADTLQAMMRPSQVYARRLVLCPICGVLEDAPTTSDMHLEIVDRRVHLRGTLPRARCWAAGVVIASSHPKDSVRTMWPAMSDDTLEPFVDLPESWPPGPLRISTVIVWDATFAVISRMARGPIRR